MKKIYGSASAFVKGRLCFTQYDSGCLRSILAKSWVRTPDIDPKHSILGEKNERRFEEQLKQAGIEFVAESPVSYPLDHCNGVVFSGRRDFVVSAGDSNEIVELKATSSKTKYQMMREGKYVVENLAQLVAYMVEAEATRGRLVYAYYKDPTAAEPHLESTYLVTIDPSGDILANGRHSGFTIADYLLHRDSAATAVSQGVVYDRPYNYDAAFGSPCQYCVFKSACDRFDSGESEFKPAVESLGLVKR